MKRDRVSTSHRSRRRSATATRARSLRAAKENGHGGAHLEQERRRTPPAVVATEGVRIPMRCTSTRRSAYGPSAVTGSHPPTDPSDRVRTRGRRMPRGRGQDRTGRRPTAPVPGPMTGPTVGRCAQGGRGAPTNRGKPEIPHWRCLDTRTFGEHPGTRKRTPLGGSTDPGEPICTRGRRADSAQCGPSGEPGPSAAAPSTYLFPSPRTNRIGPRHLRNRKRLTPTPSGPATAPPSDGAARRRAG